MLIGESAQAKYGHELVSLQFQNNYLSHFLINLLWGFQHSCFVWYPTFIGRNSIFLVIEKIILNVDRQTYFTIVYFISLCLK